MFHILYLSSRETDVTKALTSVGILVINKDGILLKLDKDECKMTKFLNRLLGLRVDLQNRLFKYFNDVLHAIIAKAKKDGKFDLGILGTCRSRSRFPLVNKKVILF